MVNTVVPLIPRIHCKQSIKWDGKISIISKSIKEWQSYGPDTKTRLMFDFWPLSVTLTLELRIWVWRAKHCLMMINSTAKQSQNPFMNNKVHGFWPLTAMCDLDLGLPRDTLSYDGQHFCNIISKSIKKWESYGSDTKNRPYFWPLISVFLTLELRTWALRATHCLIMVNISAK